MTLTHNQNKLQEIVMTITPDATLKEICNTLRKEIQLIADATKGLMKHEDTIPNTTTIPSYSPEVIETFRLRGVSPQEIISIEEQERIGEMKGNIMLAYRNLENAHMRLGKVLQAQDGGTSIYDKATGTDQEDFILKSGNGYFLKYDGGELPLMTSDRNKARGFSELSIALINKDRMTKAGLTVTIERYNEPEKEIMPLPTPAGEIKVMVNEKEISIPSGSYS